MPGVSPTTVAVVHASLLFDARYRRRLNMLGFLVSKREMEAEFMRGSKFRFGGLRRSVALILTLVLRG